MKKFNWQEAFDRMTCEKFGMNTLGPTGLKGPGPCPKGECGEPGYNKITWEEAISRLNHWRYALRISGVDDVIALVQEQAEEIEKLNKMLDLVCNEAAEVEICEDCPARDECKANNKSECTVEFRRWLEMEALK